MKATPLLGTCVVLALSGRLALAASLGTAFTYQGRLNDGGAPAQGTYDLRFTLYEGAEGSAQVGSTLTNAATGVTNGLFTTTLDFGKAFDGDARWLEIGVRTNGGGAFTTLSPRQPLTPAPYAVYAPNAASAATAGSASTVSANGVATASLQASAVTSDKIADGTLSVADLSPALASNTFWRLGGNSGTIPGPHFLGTADSQPLELKVNGTRTLRLESPPSGVPNLIGGHWRNVASGEGVTIGGGGTLLFPNSVLASFATIAGGIGNTIWSNAQNATIGGGSTNTIQACAYATISGGQ